MRNNKEKIEFYIDPVIKQKFQVKLTLLHLKINKIGENYVYLLLKKN